MPMSAFCKEMIRRGMNQPIMPAPGLLEESRQAKEEAVQLRKELKEKTITVKRLETELFGLKHEIFQHPERDGNLSFSSELIEILQRGKMMLPGEIMKALDIDPKNIDAIQALAGQLHALQDLRLVEERPKGWKWIG